jgi:hypothetical protein
MHKSVPDLPVDPIGITKLSGFTSWSRWYKKLPDLPVDPDGGCAPLRQRSRARASRAVPAVSTKRVRVVREVVALGSIRWISFSRKNGQIQKCINAGVDVIMATTLCDFCQLSAKKNWRFFSMNNVMIKFLQKNYIAVVSTKKKFDENIFTIITSGPGYDCSECQNTKYFSM